MKDIARLTGLGLATISSYFNGGNVREKNRVKIEKAIEELHYEVNEVARGLKTNATKTIGVVIPELNNIFCAEIITGMEDILRSHGYATIVCDCRTDKKLEQEAVEFLIRRRVDGIINMPVDETGAHLKKFQKTGKPIVLIDRKIQGIPCDSVLVDNKKAAEYAMQLFIEKGHKKIGIIGGPEGIFTAEERLEGYYTAASDVDGFVSQLRALTDPAVHSAAAARSAEGHQRYTKAAVLSYWKNCYASLLPQAQPVPQARGDLHL